MNKNGIILILTFIFFWIIYLSLQNASIYNRTLGLFAENWKSENNEKKLLPIPYEHLENSKLIRWDVNHYKFIKDFGYNYKIAGGEFIFAYYPLFPFIWKITGLSNIGVLFLNYFLFSISIFILTKLFCVHNKIYINLVLALSLPSLIIFLIPYTEALFLMTITIGIYGFMKNKYWIYFIGFLMASMTRPCYIFLLMSFIGTEIYFFYYYKNTITLLKNLIYKITPLIIGTFLVSILQMAYGSNSIIKFIEVQKYWNHTLSIPHNLADWSQEGFAINLGIIFLIFIPILVILLQKFYIQYFVIREIRGINTYEKSNYLIILSMFYVIGLCLFIIFFQGGSLHNLFRYTICSPFFFVILFASYKYIEQISMNYRVFFILTFSLLSIFVLGLANYSTMWNFSDFGIFILILTLFLWLLQDYLNQLVYKLLLYLNFTLNILWTSYLFNTYVSDGWIFA